MVLGGKIARFPTNLTFWMITETSNTVRHLRPVPEQSIVVPEDPVMVTIPFAACDALTREPQLEIPLKVWEGSKTFPPGAALSIIVWTVSDEHKSGRNKSRQLDIASHAAWIDIVPGNLPAII